MLQNKGSITDAEDIFQKALLHIAVRYKQNPFTIKYEFEAYLFTVCKNMWKRELKISKNKVTYTDLHTQQDNSIDMSFAVLEQKRWELFTESLEHISDNCKKILSLYFNKKPYHEIVKEMQYASELAARQRVFKCKAKLREAVKKDKRFNSLKNL